MPDLPREIRGVMIPVTGGRVLLPNATVAEVITYAQPERIANAPHWLLGQYADRVERRGGGRIAPLIERSMALLTSRDPAAAEAFVPR